MVQDFNVRIYRYLGPSKKVTVHLYNTLEISGLDVNFSRNLRISNKTKKKRKPLNSMKFTKRAMVHSKETRESQKEFWDECVGGKKLQIQKNKKWEFVKIYRYLYLYLSLSLSLSLIHLLTTRLCTSPREPLQAC